MEPYTEPSRLIEIAGCFNLRDIGGYRTHDQRRTRWRTLLRSASLHRLTPDSWRTLRDHGLRTIIDLRRSSETGRDSYLVDEVLGLRYQHIPIFDDDRYAVVDKPARNLDQLYRLLLDHCGAQFAAVLRAIAAQDSAPALIHCAVGKDRTGLAIALALGVAGVDAATIADDYALSSALLGPLFEEFRAYGLANGGDMQRLEAMLISEHATMLGALGYLDTRYGGINVYLAQAGMTEAELARLQATLVE
ncbi:MAG: tyrosine-protein phosphatase [Roseiflexaceae bacterium]